MDSRNGAFGFYATGFRSASPVFFLLRDSPLPLHDPRRKTFGGSDASPGCRQLLPFVLFFSPSHRHHRTLLLLPSLAPSFPPLQSQVIDKPPPSFSFFTSKQYFLAFPGVSVRGFFPKIKMDSPSSSRNHGPPHSFPLLPAGRRPGTP